ncbi:liprin-alpha-1 isoform X2 [Calliphora vicina]|uniref:liprin-alpha-1 isoform X2 n=1 Tax=Calliphora vicina TaxID=7373 RepID=UPI00325BC66A
MDSSHHVTVPLRYGIKKMRKRRDLDALLSQSHNKNGGNGSGGGGGGCGGGGALRRCNNSRGAVYSQDKLLNNASTDDQEDYTWQPKIKQPPHHCGHNKQMIFRLYGILLFVITLSIFVGFTYWLNFNLQQQIYEYRQKVEQVSAASQILPDTLQAWHETSKSLIKNQTSMSLKITELQQSLQELWKNFSEYRSSQEAQKSYEKEEKIVADFGAKIEAIATDVESMKEHYNAVKEKQTDLQQVFENLKSNFSDGLKNMALPINYTEELKSLRSDLQTKINKIESNTSYINDTLTQKSIIMQEELVKHKTKLDELFDRSANITSHVTSLENSWPEYKQKVINLGNDIPRIEKDISILSVASQKMELSFKNICNECQNSYIEALQHNMEDEKPVEKVQSSQTKTTTTTLRPVNV